MFVLGDFHTSIIRTGSHILVEQIDLVNSVIIFLSQMTLLRSLTCILGSQTVILSPALSDLPISSDASICSAMALLPLRNSNNVVVSVSIDFPSNSQWDVSFHCIGDYFRVVWDGLCYHLRDVHGGISLNSVLLLLLVNLVSRFSLELMYISLIASIKSSLIHLHDFQLLVLLL